MLRVILFFVLITSISLSNAQTDPIITPETISQITIYRQLPHDSGVEVVAFSPDSRYLATGDGEGNVTIWDHVSGELIDTWRTERANVTVLTFSPDSTRLHVGVWSSDYIYVFNVEALKRSRLDDVESNTKSIFFNEDGERYVITDDAIDLYDANNRHQSTIQAFRSIFLRGGAITPSGLFVGDYTTLFHLPSPNADPVSVFEFENQIETVIASNTGAYVGATDNYVLHLFDSDTTELLHSFEFARSAAFSPDDQLVVYGTSSRFIAHDLTVNQEVFNTAVRAGVRAISFSADGRFIATASGRSVIVWGFAEG
jgi:WD40 repeat protein